MKQSPKLDKTPKKKVEYSLYRLVVSRLKKTGPTGITTQEIKRWLYKKVDEKEIRNVLHDMEKLKVVFRNGKLQKRTVWVHQSFKSLVQTQNTENPRPQRNPKEWSAGQKIKAQRNANTKGTIQKVTAEKITVRWDSGDTSCMLMDSARRNYEKQ